MRSFPIEDIEDIEPIEPIQPAIVSRLEECTGLEVPDLLMPNVENLDVFMFSLEPDAIALTSATGGLLAPFPQGIQNFDEPEIAEGVFVATKVLDYCGELIGFGSEQELLVPNTPLGITTFTLTLPDRGTLLLTQTEDFSAVFAEIQDMKANQEPVRTFNPPLAVVTTMPDTGAVVGGIGSFDGKTGFMIEIDYVFEINLDEGTADITDVLLVGYD